MSYKIGQLRKNQINDYFTPIGSDAYKYEVGSKSEESSEESGRKSYIGSTAVFDSFIGINNKLIKDNNYYLSFKIGSWSNYHFKIKLMGEDGKISMTVKEFKTRGTEICELVFTPNDDNYTMIVIEKVRNDTSDTNGVIIDSSSIKLHLLTNIITKLNARYDSLAYLKKMGLQGPPGLLFSMNGEEFHMGKSGIYEIQDINITNLSFVIKDDVAEADGKQKNYFIMDFQY